MSTDPVNETFRKWELQLRKGLLAFLVLGELAKAEHYGYSLIAALTKTLEADMAEGTIYPLLSRLQRDQLIESNWQIQSSGPARKYYRITEQGLDLLDEMHRHWQHVNRRITRQKAGGRKK